MKVSNKIGERIREVRKKSGFSGTQLAHKLDTSKQVLSNWEHGRRTPAIETLIQISNVLNVSLSYLMCVDDDPESPRVYNLPLLNQDTILNNTSDIEIKFPAEFVSSSDIISGLFAFKLYESSMEPLFRKGDIIVFSKKKVQHQDFVLLKVNTTGQVIFRQFLIDNSDLSDPKAYLHATSSNNEGILFDEDLVTVLGVCSDNCRIFC